MLATSTCGHNPGSDSTSYEVESLQPEKTEGLRQETTKTSDNAVAEKVSTDEEPETLKKLMLIKKGKLKFETRDVGKTYTKVKGLAKDFEGYIGQETQLQTNFRLAYNMEIRIPSRNFDAFMLSLDAGVEQYEQRSIQVDDISEEFLDLKIRLENKRALAARYRQLLPRTNKMEDILELEKELQNVSGDIDRIEGRMRFLKDQTSFSTIKIQFYKRIETKERVRKDQSFGARFFKNLKNGWHLILEFFLGLTQLWPFLLIFGIVGGLFWRKYKQNKEPQEPKPEA